MKKIWKKYEKKYEKNTKYYVHVLESRRTTPPRTNERPSRGPYPCRVTSLLPPASDRAFRNSLLIYFFASRLHDWKERNERKEGKERKERKEREERKER